MPLLPGKKNIGSNIRELHHGPQYQQTAAKFGKHKADMQTVAIAMSKARERGKHK